MLRAELLMLDSFQNVFGFVAVNTRGEEERSITVCGHSVSVYYFLTLGLAIIFSISVIM